MIVNANGTNCKSPELRLFEMLEYVCYAFVWKIAILQCPKWHNRCKKSEANGR